MSLTNNDARYVFVGGKGGVGKTTTSSALALSYSDKGLKTLIVSTDPAHSLGDALDINLSTGNIIPIVTESNLWALEIDVNEALNEFKSTLDGFDSNSLASSLGVPQDVISSLGLEDITSIFTNPPPGVDEIVALTKIFKYGNEKNHDGSLKYDRIVIDTAPTGHTMRLMQLPDFLNSVTIKLISFRSKIMSAVSTFKNMFGGAAAIEEQKQQEEAVDNALEKLEDFKERLMNIKSALMNPKDTNFVVVTIPTQLAVSESKRLVNNLNSEGIEVGSIICNQIIAEEADNQYLNNRVKTQEDAILMLKSKTSSDTYNNNVEITQVPYCDTEVIGPYGLRFFASLAHPPVAKTATNPMDSRKLTIFGGKGGVGKTTSAASWGVQLADSGMRTLIVSTDPAHSLGDALGMQLNGFPIEIDTGAATMGIDIGGFGQLWAMEIDPQGALDEFKTLIEDSMGTAEGGGGGGAMAGMGLPDVKKELINLLGDTEDPPPGTDEVVAMTKIIQYLENGYTTPSGQIVKFDRIVLDTAPTGHTLRMLNLPSFIQDLIDKLINIRDKVGVFGSMMGGSLNNDSGNNGEREDKLLEFQKRMEKLEDMLHSPTDTDFTIVTIPTALATAETTRLLKTLQTEAVSVRRLIINQVLTNSQEKEEDNSETDSSSSSSEAFLDRTRRAQVACLQELEKCGTENNLDVIKVPYFEMELRTTFGLRLLSNVLSNT